MPEPAPAPAGLATSPAPAATPETGRAAATGLAGTAVDKLSTFTPAATQTVVARGDYLNKVASRWYPGNSDMGMEAIILANLKSSREDLIYPGQVLFLPKLNLSQGIIQLQDNLFYAPYGHYRAFEQLQQAMARLNQHKVRYLLINTISGDGGTTHRIFLGGYEQFKDLERAMKILATTPG